MKKIIKNWICFSLILSLIFTFSTSVYASPLEEYNNALSSSENNIIDYYASNYSEIVLIDNTEYYFTYYYDESHNRCIDIFNTDTSRTDVISYHNSNNAIYQNGAFVSTVTTRSFHPTVLYDANWVYFDSVSKTISHLDTLIATAFAAAVAVIVGTYCTASAVISAIGLVGINDIISHFEDATVNSIIYKFNSNLVTQFRYDWTVTPSGGSKYGPYMTLTPVL